MNRPTCPRCAGRIMRDDEPFCLACGYRPRPPREEQMRAIADLPTNKAKRIRQ